MPLKNLSLILILTLSNLVACEKIFPKEKRERDPTISEIYNQAIDRLQGMSENGWIVSRWDDGSTEHEGEALLWNGTLIANSSCEDSRPQFDRIMQTIEDRDGQLVRYTPLGEYENGRGLTNDGEFGLYYGMAGRIARCPDDRPRIREAWQRRQAYLDRNSGELYPGSGIRLVPGFSILVDIIEYSLDLRTRPTKDRQRLLETEVIAWAAAVKIKKASCYRVNLSLIILESFELLGFPITNEGKYQFCAVTDGMDLPTVDHWCGRRHIADYVENFSYDEWEYRHQRCGAWETPDGKEGLETPGLDLIVAIWMGYGT